MNRRQRKKVRRREFQEFGFDLQFCTPNAWSDAQQDAFWQECILRIEAFGLCVGGGCGTCWDVFVTALGSRATVTPDQRTALVRWLSAHPSVTLVKAGELVDAWHHAWHDAR
jgi:uncharacterized protein YggL (DUF469 family)